MKSIPWLSIVLVLGLFGYRRGALACRIGKLPHSPLHGQRFKCLFIYLFSYNKVEEMGNSFFENVFHLTAPKFCRVTKLSVVKSFEVAQRRPPPFSPPGSDPDPDPDQRNNFVSVVLQLFHYNVSDSTAKENVEIRVFNHDYRATVDEIHSLLERAKLEHRGFTKSAIKKSIASVDEQPIYTTTLHFDKTVPCKRLAFVEQEIRWLLPEVWGLDISKRVVSTVSRGMFNGGKICTAGIEIHLPPQRGYTGGIEKRETCYEWCLLCFHAATRN